LQGASFELQDEIAALLSVARNDNYNYIIVEKVGQAPFLVKKVASPHFPS